MASNPQIISDLKVIMEANHHLELLMNFKGVPFICKARVESVEENQARLTALDPAMVCLMQEKQARVLGSDYFEPAIAKVAFFDISTGAAELTDFSYVGSKLGERMIVRVEPKAPVEVVLDGAGVKITGTLADISLNGAGVRIAPVDYNAALKPGTNLQISMKLPTGNIALAGTVLSAIKTSDFYRLSIRFEQNVPQKGLIFRYLVERRAEIERELLESYAASVRNPDSKTI